MQKADIARHIHKQAGISETESAKVLACVLGLLKTTLQAGEPITIQGFGKFIIRGKRARQGRNPRTRVAVMIPARRVVTCHPSLVLKAAVNGVPVRSQQ